MKTIFQFLILFFALAPNAQAFPTLVNHGYTTCVTCHYNPSGGGLLNSYGKYIAGELFGTFNDSESALPWLTPAEDERKFVAGLLARGAQTHFDNPQVRRGNFERMQFDLETGVSIKQFFALGTVGFRGSAHLPGQRELDLKVRSYYTGFRDVNYAIRVGKFYPEFGIRHPNHNLPTRKGLFWNQGDEPYVTQASWFTTVADLTVAYLHGAPETQLSGKYGFSETVTVKTNTTRSGISRLDATDGKDRVWATSLFTQLGYLEKGYTLAEVARKGVSNFGQETTDRDLAFVESGWEVFKGFFPYVGYQLTKTVKTGAATMGYPVGFKFFPVTHFELDGEYQILNIKSPHGIDKGEAAFLMVNAYF